MLFNLDFANDIILSYFFSFFFFIDLYFLVYVAPTQIFNPIVELVNPIEVEMEIHPVIVEIKISECSI